jgi:hypothetical protein
MNELLKQAEEQLRQAASIVAQQSADEILAMQILSCAEQVKLLITND